MSDVVSSTSPLQYLNQLNVLDWLRQLARKVIVPSAVVAELDAGRNLGVDVPDPSSLSGIEVRDPHDRSAIPNLSSLGAGEADVLALGLELTDATLLLDDGQARRAARSLGLKIRGTLGVLLDAKNAGLTPAIAPLLDELDRLGFRLSSTTRTEILRLAGE